MLLKTEEVLLIKFLLRINPKIAEIILPTLDNTFVENMDDGGMGSLLFISCTDNITQNKVGAIHEFPLQSLFQATFA
jgi:hypothetical protein